VKKITGKIPSTAETASIDINNIELRDSLTTVKDINNYF
jgi:hypothetical protein